MQATKKRGNSYLKPIRYCNKYLSECFKTLIKLDKEMPYEQFINKYCYHLTLSNRDCTLLEYVFPPFDRRKFRFQSSMVSVKDANIQILHLCPYRDEIEVKAKLTITIEDRSQWDSQRKSNLIFLSEEQLDYSQFVSILNACGRSQLHYDFIKATKKPEDIIASSRERQLVTHNEEKLSGSTTSTSSNALEKTALDPAL